MVFETTLSLLLVDLGELNARIEQADAYLKAVTNCKATAQRNVDGIRSRTAALEDTLTPGMRRHPIFLWRATRRHSIKLLKNQLVVTMTLPMPPTMLRTTWAP